MIHIIENKANVTCAPGYRLHGSDDNENVTENYRMFAYGYWSKPNWLSAKE
ncbi:hypothetical protein DPMN_149241 [Dreissena polymorpha]|uniref:Uncharacterized protein n=1 Tax=Dreissena polymorpha TaxID=45954 RepID=A0A9D4FBD3_DREPO|nr:hypothetical protein DPMN_149241 [Dreissena polymorpha]